MKILISQPGATVELSNTECVTLLNTGTVVDADHSIKLCGMVGDPPMPNYMLFDAHHAEGIRVREFRPAGYFG